ncbi:MAG: AraC family transcriptional regulator ligand-binding domain-containing protein [Alcanivoracaceae bacterium]|nr:AraC family transcriptional regulator ligand-binding domain-containing protein [Alcanivoracaceae bacterium]
MSIARTASMDVALDRLMAPYLARLVKAACDNGADEQAVLAGTGLTLRRLQQPELALPVMTGLRVLEQVYASGLDIRKAMTEAAGVDLRSHGFLGYAVLASSTLGDALELALRYLRTRTGLLTLSYHSEGDTGVLRFDEGVPLGELYTVVMDVVVASLFNIGRQMFGEVPPVTEVRFAYSRAPHHDLVIGMIEGEVRFDCAWCEIAFPAHWLSRTTGTADPQLVKLATEQCERALQDMAQAEGLLGRVRQLAEQYLTEARSMDRVAEALHMTPRTLRRRLQAQNTTYQAVVEQLRGRLAMDMLAHSERPVDDIAARLGYNDPSNFGRAFRRWTGLSPTAWRDSRRS